jgi:hypothetical protein
MKIICTGNPTKGIAKSIKELYPETYFVSRSNGYDLSTDTGLYSFKKMLPYYDVFINHSQLKGDTQSKLLKCAREVWATGHVINIGSVMEFPQWEWIEPVAAEQKRQLRDLSLSLSSEHFKTSHVIVGGLQSSNNDPLRIHPDQVAKTIKWILENENHIPLMYVDKVSDQLIEHYRKYTL